MSHKIQNIPGLVLILLAVSSGLIFIYNSRLEEEKPSKAASLSTERFISRPTPAPFPSDKPKSAETIPNKPDLKISDNSDITPFSTPNHEIKQSTRQKRYNPILIWSSDPEITTSHYSEEWLANLREEWTTPKRLKPMFFEDIEYPWLESVADSRGISPDEVLLLLRGNEPLEKSDRDGQSISNSGEKAEADGSIQTQESAAVEEKNYFRPIKLDPFNAVKVVAFLRGVDSDGILLPPVDPLDIVKIISGIPDYSLQSDTPGPSVLTLGLGGALILEVKNNGYLKNGPGPDIVIYENPFLIRSRRWRRKLGSDYFIETGCVAVWGVENINDINNESALKKYEFTCNYKGRPYYQGCAGVHPVIPAPKSYGPLAMGGDVFDLSDLEEEVVAVKRIEIKDCGGNLMPRAIQGKGKEGFDLDSIALLHAYYEPGDTIR